MVGTDGLSWGDSIEKEEAKAGKTWPASKAAQVQLARPEDI